MCNRAETSAKMKNVGLCLSLSSSVLSKSTGLIRVYLGVFFFKFVIFHVYRVYRVYFCSALIFVCIPTCGILAISVPVNGNFPYPPVSIRVYRVYLWWFSCLSCLSFWNLDAKIRFLLISGRVYRLYRVYPCLSCLSLPFFMSIVSISGTCLFFRVYRIYFWLVLMTFVSIRVYRFYFSTSCLCFSCLSYLSMQSGWDVLQKK